MIVKKILTLSLIGVMALTAINAGDDYQEDRRKVATMMAPLLYSSNMQWSGSDLNIDFEVSTYSPKDDLEFIVSIYFYDGNNGLGKIKTVYLTGTPKEYNLEEGELTQGVTLPHQNNAYIRQNVVKIRYTINDLTQDQIDKLKPLMAYRVYVKNKHQVENMEEPKISQYFAAFIANMPSSSLGNNNLAYSGSDAVNAQRYIVVKSEENFEDTTLRYVFDALSFEAIRGSNIGTQDQVNQNLLLPTSLNGVSFVWSSSNTSSISNTGVVTQLATVQSATLCATLTYNNEQRNKCIPVTVLENEDLSLLTNTLNSLDFNTIKGTNSNGAYAVTENLVLPSSINGVSIRWSSSNVNIVNIVNSLGNVTRDTSDKSVTLTATLSKDNIEKVKAISVVVKAENSGLPTF